MCTENRSYISNLPVFLIDPDVPCCSLMFLFPWCHVPSGLFFSMYSIHVILRCALFKKYILGLVHWQTSDTVGSCTRVSRSIETTKRRAFMIQYVPLYKQEFIVTSWSVNFKSNKWTNHKHLVILAFLSNMKQVFQIDVMFHQEVKQGKCLAKVMSHWFEKR